MSFTEPRNVKNPSSRVGNFILLWFIYYMSESSQISSRETLERDSIREFVYWCATKKLWISKKGKLQTYIISRFPRYTKKGITCMIMGILNTLMHERILWRYHLWWTIWNRKSFVLSFIFHLTGREEMKKTS